MSNDPIPLALPFYFVSGVLGASARFFAWFIPVGQVVTPGINLLHMPILHSRVHSYSLDALAFTGAPPCMLSTRCCYDRPVTCRRQCSLSSCALLNAGW